MKLMTKAIADVLKKQQDGLYAQDGKGFKSKVIVKYFNPIGVGSWYITAGEEQENGDWLLYGYAILQCGEWGYVRLSELEHIRLPYNLSIERDLVVKPNKYTVEEILRLDGKLPKR